MKPKTASINGAFGEHSCQTQQLGRGYELGLSVDAFDGSSLSPEMFLPWINEMLVSIPIFRL